MTVKATSVPKALLHAAVTALGDQLIALGPAASGADLLWAFFDGRVAPGRRLAVEQLCARGVSVAQATKQVDAAAKAARATGQVFAVGVLASGDELVSLLRRLAGDAVGVANVSAWIKEDVPKGWFRLVIVVGSTTQLQLASIDGVLAQHRATKR